MLKHIFLLTVLLLGVQRAGAFALLGPNNEPFQSPVIGYNPNAYYDGLPTAAKNIAEEYRWNIPVLYYAYNENFLEYFGLNGAAAIDEAFAVLNNLTNVSSYSADLSEFPLESRRDNYLAQQLSLFDLKTEALTMFVEQLGLAEPERYIWCLLNRYLLPNGTCPQDMVYDVIMRNYDPIASNLEQLQYSKYVNGNRFYYIIREYCTDANSIAPPLLADAFEFPIDPTANNFSAVASRTYGYGGFYSGMTRDDIAGLRYLYRTNNMNIESSGTNTIAFVTNNTQQLLFTSNLTVLIEAALVNGPGALSALFPGLQIGSSTPIFTNIITTNVVFYVTNSPTAPAGAAVLRSAQVITTNIETYFRHEFLNVYITPQHQLFSNFDVPLVPGHTVTNGHVSFVITNISAEACPPFSPYGSICTNVTTVVEPVTAVFGDYYILPTNLCAVSIVRTQLTTLVTVTEPTFVVTNAPGTTNFNNVFFSVTPTYSFMQYAYVVKPVTCPENTVARRQGIERVRFERRDFDSLLNRFFYPITNQYTLVALTNNTLVTQVIQRIITTPDFLINAESEDLNPGPGTVLGAVVPTSRSVEFDEGNASPGLNGPGTIETPTIFSFNKIGPVYQNFAPNFLDEAGQIPWFIWGSFDASTNLPTIYPNGTSIINLENQIMIQLSPAGPVLPSVQVNQSYATVFSGFTVTGGTAPYAWTLPDPLAGLPPGLNLNSTTGQIIGLPTTQGIYDLTIRMTDATGRFVDRAYSITVTP